VKKNQDYIVTDRRPQGPVFLVTGGERFNWWTVHRSMASRLPKAKAEGLVTRLGGDLLPVREG
jgi:hypothetical protein